MSKTSEALKGLKKAADIAPVTPELPQVEKVGKRVARPGKQNAGGLGGARPGSGRKPMEVTTVESAELRRKFTEMIRMHANELINVQEIDKITGKTKIVQRRRFELAVEILFREVQKREGWAIKEYLDRLLGKAVQPIAGDEDAPIALRIDF